MFGEISVRKRLEHGDIQFSVFINTASPIATELAGWAGYDVLMLDHEHSPADIMNAFQCMNGARGTESEVWVRIPANDAAYIKKILDCGADGVMCPMVNTAAEATRLVAACRYPPHGIRGFAPTLTRHTNFGFRREEYFRRVDEDLLIMAQIESREAVDNAEAIAAVDGLHMLFIGPMDLSKSLGHANEMGHPEVVQAISHVEEAIRKSGKLMGTMVMPGGDLGALIDHGYTFIILGADVALLRTAMQNQVAGARQAATAQLKISG